MNSGRKNRRKSGIGPPGGPISSSSSSSSAASNSRPIEAEVSQTKPIEKLTPAQSNSEASSQLKPLGEAQSKLGEASSQLNVSEAQSKLGEASSQLNVSEAQSIRYIIGIDAGVKTGLARLRRDGGFSLIMPESIKTGNNMRPIIRNKINNQAAEKSKKKTGLQKLKRSETGTHLALSTSSFWDVYEFITSFHSPNNTLIIIENPALNKTTFGRAANRKGMERISRNVGSNIREATLLIAGFRRLGFKVVEVCPKTKKWLRSDLRAIAGYTGSSSQHARDAAKLIFETEGVHWC